MNGEKRQSEHSSQMSAGESRLGMGICVCLEEWMANCGCEAVSAQLWICSQ